MSAPRSYVVWVSEMRCAGSSNNELALFFAAVKPAADEARFSTDVAIRCVALGPLACEAQSNLEALNDSFHCAVPRDQLAQISGNGTYRVVFGHRTCARSAFNGIYWGLELGGSSSLVRVRRPDGE